METAASTASSTRAERQQHKESQESGQNNMPHTVPDSEKRAKVFAALSDPTRVRLAQLLASHEELTGTELADELNISLALFCHHSSKMADAGLLVRRKASQTTYYALNREILSQSVAPLLCPSTNKATTTKSKTKR